MEFLCVICGSQCCMLHCLGISIAVKLLQENLKISDLIAEFLSNVVERRLKRNLSFGYQNQISELNRVRGRIDLLRTERKQLLSRGQIACQYEDLTVNTARNRFVRAALGSIAGIVSRRELAHRCLSLSESLRRIGVIRAS